MVFGPGDRVTGQGRLVADVDGDWLDPNQTWPLGLSPGVRPRSAHCVRLVDANFADLPATCVPGDIASGIATVAGRWLGDAIRVESLTASRYGRRAVPDWSTPPCPAPPRGWPHGGRDQNTFFQHGDLWDSGAAVTRVTFRPSRTQTVLVVAATDIAAAESFLRPQLPGRLCVVASRFTRAQLTAVCDHLLARWEEWALYGLREHVDEQAQASIKTEPLRVTTEIADWAETVPKGILTLAPILTTTSPP